MKKYLMIGLFLAVVFMPLIVSAALPNPTNPISGGGGSAITVGEITDLIQRFARWLIVISVVIAVIIIIYGGIMWMLSRGNDTKAGEAKKIVWNGIIGAAVVLAVGVILQTVAAIVNRTALNF